MASRIGFRLRPRSVREYSTRGGTSAYTSRCTRPFASIARSWTVSTFWETLPTHFFSSPKRLVPVIRSRRINTFHLSPIRVRVVSTGQAGSSFFFTSSIATTSKILLKARRGGKCSRGALVPLR